MNRGSVRNDATKRLPKQGNMWLCATGLTFAVILYGPAILYWSIYCSFVGMFGRSRARIPWISALLSFALWTVSVYMFWRGDSAVSVRWLVYGTGLIFAVFAFHNLLTENRREMKEDAAMGQRRIRRVDPATICDRVSGMSTLGDHGPSDAAPERVNREHSMSLKLLSGD